MASPWPRLQLFEFNDLHAVPAAARDTIVESLSRALEWGRVLDGLVDPFMEFLAASGAREVLDLGAGAGGPARILARALARRGRASPRFLLTDLHPRVEAWTRSRDAFPDAIDFVPTSVDATRVPEELARDRARTIINVLHHFPPELATAVLADAVRGSKGVFVAEGFERHPSQFANFALAGLPALYLNPIMSERDRLAKAALTYATPAALAMSIWDGFVSTLRVYEEEELRAMVAPFGASFHWTYGRYHYAPRGTGYYFHGVPMSEREKHWQNIYGTKSSQAVSWYEREATASLDFVEAARARSSDPVVDVGAGASVLVDGLLARGFSDVTLLDVSAKALEVTRARVGERKEVHYVTSDVTSWKPARAYALWHDRAVFHFLTEPAARAQYRDVLRAALRPGGSAIIATFAEDGPERCSGLPVRRYSPAELADELSPVLEMVESRRVVHATPSGAEQRFVFGRFTRK